MITFSEYPPKHPTHVNLDVDEFSAIVLRNTAGFTTIDYASAMQSFIVTAFKAGGIHRRDSIVQDSLDRVTDQALRIMGDEACNLIYGGTDNFVRALGSNVVVNQLETV